MSQKIIFFVFFSFIFFLTQQFNFDVTYLSLMGFSDSLSYEAIYKCISLKNCNELYTDYASIHLQRWFPHYLIGFINYKLSVPANILYFGFIFILFIYCYYAIYKMNKDDYTFYTFTAFILLNPLSFRQFFYCPYMISDAIFFTSIVIFVSSILSRNSILFFSAVLMSAISRQTALMLLPIMFLLGYYNIFNLRNIIISFLLLIITLMANVFLAFKIFGAESSDTISDMIALKGWSTNHNTSIMDNISFLENIFYGNEMLILYFSFGIIILFNIFQNSPIILLRFKKEYLFIMLLGISLILLQPLIAGPKITGENFSRLAVFALPFICLASNKKGASLRSIIFIIGLFFLMSLHHNYSILQDKFYYGFIVFSITSIVSVIFVINKVFIKKIS